MIQHAKGVRFSICIHHRGWLKTPNGLIETWVETQKTGHNTESCTKTPKPDGSKHRIKVQITGNGPKHRNIDLIITPETQTKKVQEVLQKF